MKGYQGLPRDYTTSFNALNPSSLPGPEYFSSGGMSMPKKFDKTTDPADRILQRANEARLNNFSNIYEAPTTSGGTSLTIHRRNRSLETTSTGAAVYAPTVSALGTEIFGEIVTSGQGGTGSGGGGITDEYVLKPLTTYLFRITNTNSQAHISELLIAWYE